MRRTWSTRNLGDSWSRKNSSAGILANSRSRPSALPQPPVFSQKTAAGCGLSIDPEQWRIKTANNCLRPRHAELWDCRIRKHHCRWTTGSMRRSGEDGQTNGRSKSNRRAAADNIQNAHEHRRQNRARQPLHGTASERSTMGQPTNRATTGVGDFSEIPATQLCGITQPSLARRER